MLYVSDYKFCSYVPSVIAGASLAAALNGLEYAAIYKYDLFTKLHNIIGAPKVSRIARVVVVKEVAETFLFTPKNISRVK